VLSAPVRVCFVCSGNICRSPTAEVVLTAIAAEAGTSELVEVSSAGTGSWHAGDDMDARSRRTLVQAGYSWGRHVARQFVPADFASWDPRHPPRDDLAPSVAIATVAARS
jgi:protein-tyrosine phosphatase